MVYTKRKMTCSELFNCCDCGNRDGGCECCAYCFSCNACENCLKDDSDDADCLYA